MGFLLDLANQGQFVRSVAQHPRPSMSDTCLLTARGVELFQLASEGLCDLWLHNSVICCFVLVHPLEPAQQDGPVPALHHPLLCFLVALVVAQIFRSNYACILEGNDLTPSRLDMISKTLWQEFVFLPVAIPSMNYIFGI